VTFVRSLHSLTGPDGAAAVFGPQKGADPEQVRLLDDGLAHFVDVLAGQGYGHAPQLAAAAGAGAAGGVGFGAMLLGGRAVSGADFFLDLLDFAKHVNGCDLVITGEGRIDDQTLHGKLPAVVAQRAAPVPVIAVVGRSDLSERARQAMGLSAVHAVVDHTDGDPARDPDLTIRVLRELGATIPLEGVRETPSPQRPGVS
jgi:glycerate kinase